MHKDTVTLCNSKGAVPKATKNHPIAPSNLLILQYAKFELNFKKCHKLNLHDAQELYSTRNPIILEVKVGYGTVSTIWQSHSCIF